MKKKQMTDKSHQETDIAAENPPILDIPLQEPIFDRKKLLELTAACINETYNRVSGERFRPRDGDRERIAYLKLLKDYITLHTSLLTTAKAPAFDGIPMGDTRTPEQRESDRKFLKRFNEKCFGFIE